MIKSEIINITYTIYYRRTLSGMKKNDSFALSIKTRCLSFMKVYVPVYVILKIYVMNLSLLLTMQILKNCDLYFRLFTLIPNKR